MESDGKWCCTGDGSHARHLAGRGQTHSGRTGYVMRDVSRARGERLDEELSVCVMCVGSMSIRQCADRLL